MKRLVLDSGVFIENIYNHGYTTPEVELETQVPTTVEVRHTKPKFIEKVKKKSKETGDFDVLSKADISILALALELGGTVVSNDFAVLNVAKSLSLEILGANKTITHQIEWVWYCPACKKIRKNRGNCINCGTKTKRRPKTKKDL